ncbi:MAG TPA: hypothetical protein VL049_01525 [Candidatus Dormibacteraeota bacterium]|nr:hypothetical protein [Candidatus Dormibacteraeota bacterium]
MTNTPTGIPTKTGTITRTPPNTFTPSRTATVTATPTITRTPTPTSALSGPVVSYAAAIAQDGCPFCCEYSCMLTPTPTPYIDENGRQVFVNHIGQFLLVVEARRGTSNSNPGTNLFPSGSDRGDLQVLVSEPIGDPSDPVGFGSTRVCDIGPPPTPFGGVPGIDPPTFGADQSITDAIHDMQCRFSIQETTAVACTRDNFGNFAYLGANTRTQFCYQVPMTAAFQRGRTIVAIQLRDLAGNLGPRKEIVVDVEP